MDPWRYLPTNFPPWEAVSQQTLRWISADVFEAMPHDLRELLRRTQGRDPDPSAVMFDNTTRQSMPESGAQAGHDGYKWKKGRKVHIAVDTFGHLLALHVSPADAQDREQVAVLAEADHGIDLVVVTLEQAKRSFVLLPGVGWWSAGSPGPPASGASQEITNAYQRRSKGSMSSRSPATCSNNCCSSPRKVPNRRRLNP
jgi:hypothetical protein